ncbi:pimeloyl-ACP methyl esterase BioG family protein [Campylobacter sp.]|uniref:pimeloyl-ACP methyl esterase BioG family protein n=1 Tax=Campylobacter sp. TaxID=205 RepID=UPI0025C50509|nr:pimeloyl-ACP methyl esterase BioG family protein [Campylobacter sp.]
MKTYFLHKNQHSSNLILFFSGFGSHFSHFSHLKSDENVLMIYDYTSFEFDFDLSKFEKITLIAFSMGVCVASKILKDVKFDKKIAINGTNLPINDEFGIKNSIFKLTMKNFDLENFKVNLLEKKLDLSENFYFETTQYLKQELLSLYDFCIKDLNENLIWDRALISKDDKIFPSKNTLNFFKEKAKIIDEPHFVFFKFNFWEELCKLF